MFILYLNESHHNFTLFFFQLALNLGLNLMVTGARAANSFISLSPSNHLITLLSVTFYLSLAHIPLSTWNQKVSIVMVLTGCLGWWDLRRCVAFFQLLALLESFVIDICHFHKSIKYMQAGSHTCPNLLSAFFSPNFLCL